ncbi:MAG: tetratricopeptide repeat protein [bacterium]
MKSSWGRWGFAAISLLLIFSLIGCASSSYYVRSAKLHINNKNYAEAEKILLEGTNTPPNDQDPELWYTLGLIRFDKKDWVGMNEAFDKSLALDAKFAEQIKKTKYHAWQRIASGAVKEFQGNNYPQAISDFQTALIVRPSDSETLTNLGLSYFKNEQYNEAAEAFKESIANDTTNLVKLTKLNLLETYRLLERSEDVITLADDIINTADSLNTTRKIIVIQAKAVALQKLGRTEDAVGEWDKLMLEDPTNADFAFNKALLLDMLERYNEAAAVYLKAIELNPSDYEARMRASNALLGNQQWATIEKVLEPWLFPDGVKVYEPEFKDLHTWMTLKAAYANLDEMKKMKVVDEILKKISG